MIVAVFAIGILAAVFSVLALRIGRSYYLPVIDRMKALEQRLGIDAFNLKTTPEQGGSLRLLTITDLLNGLFVGLAFIDIAGILYLVLFK